MINAIGVVMMLAGVVKKIEQHLELFVIIKG